MSPLLKKPSLARLSAEKREEFTQERVRVEIAPGGQSVEGRLLTPPGTGPFPAVLVPFYEPETSAAVPRSVPPVAQGLTPTAQT